MVSKVESKTKEVNFRTYDPSNPEHLIIRKRRELCDVIREARRVESVVNGRAQKGWQIVYPDDIKRLIGYSDFDIHFMSTMGIWPPKLINGKLFYDIDELEQLVIQDRYNEVYYVHTILDAEKWYSEQHFNQITWKALNGETFNLMRNDFEPGVDDEICVPPDVITKCGKGYTNAIGEIDADYWDDYEDEDCDLEAEDSNDNPAQGKSQQLEIH